MSSATTTKKEEEEPINIKICEGSCHCCADKIYLSLQEESQKWKAVEEKIVAQTPLHEAAAAGNTAAAVEILNLMPSLGRKLNKEGLSPLHLAVHRGHNPTVRALARFDPSLVRVKGKEGETPLMLCAAEANNPQGKRLLAALLLACPQSVKDVNNNGETVVHVALRKKNCEVVCVLLDWLRRRNEISSVLTVRDLGGDTALHAAARFGCVEGARKLVKLVKINRLNHEGKTALDVAEECSKEVGQVLRERRARKAGEMKGNVLTTTDYVLGTPTLAETISRGYFSLTKHLTLEMRGAILVVATVILTATYQGVMQPPGGLYPAQEKNTTATATATAIPVHVSSRHRHHIRRWLADKEEEADEHLAGQMVMRANYYYIFMPSNTFAFALSAVIIIFIVPGSPIFLILLICLLFMCISYLLAMDAISYYTVFSRIIYYLSMYAIIGAYFVKIHYYLVKALIVEQDWWLRRHITVRFSNWSTSSGWSSTGLVKMAEKMEMQNRLMCLN